MIRSFAVSAVIVAALLPSAMAMGNFTVWNTSFPVPEIMAPQVLIDDCTGNEEDVIWLCGNFKPYMYQGGKDREWHINFYKGSNIPAPDDRALYSTDALKNFKSLVKGEKAIGDFYDAQGVLKSENNPVFEVAPYIGTGQPFYVVNNIKPIVINNTTYGFSFTPAVGAHDFPPDYMGRVSLLYLEDKDLIVAMTRTHYGAQFTYNELEQKGKKLPDGTIDYDYYTGDNLGNLNKFLADFYTTHIAAVDPTLDAELTSAARTIITSPTSSIFTDVAVGAYLEDSVAYVKARGYVEGYQDGSFRPEYTINRAEFIKILVETKAVANLDSYANTSCFRDVATGQWYTKYICYAKAQGIIGGYPDGTFGPNKSVNVAEALKIVLNAYGISTPKEGSDWFTKYWVSATENGFLDRIPTEAFMPLTRLQMAELITRVENVGGTIYYE